VLQSKREEERNDKRMEEQSDHEQTSTTNLVEELSPSPLEVVRWCRFMQRKHAPVESKLLHNITYGEETKA
jgi:L-rhamnose isomerase